jgi:hypothetical protein
LVKPSQEVATDRIGIDKKQCDVDMKKHDLILRDVPALALAIIGGAIGGAFASAAWFFAPFIWFGFCLTLPIIPCSLARRKVVAVGVVTNSAMPVGALLQTFYVEADLVSNGYYPDTYKLSFLSTTLDLLPFLAVIAVLGGLLSLVVSKTIIKIAPAPPTV